MSRSRTSLSILFLFCVWPLAFAGAEEVDDFSDPSPLPPDSSVGINKLVNYRLDFAAKKISETYHSCDRMKLTDGLRYSLDRNFSAVGNDLRANGLSDDTEVYSISKEIVEFGNEAKEKTIYQNTSVTGCCVKRVNVNGSLVGIDKIDHLFGNGGILWFKLEDSRQAPVTHGLQSLLPWNSPKPLTNAQLLQMSANMEHGGWGLAGTGVKSYGDLSGNFQGLRFWSSLLDGENPYLKCENGVLRQVRQFDIRDYVDDAMDEGLNCSSYVSEEIVKTVRSHLSEKGLKCPKSPAKCAALVAKYRAISPAVLKTNISPLCQDPNSNFSQVEKASSISFDDLKNFAGGVHVKDVVDFVFGKGSQ